MKIPKELTTVTPLSKYLARLVFITLPVVGFFLGMRYQEMVDLTKRQEMEENLSIPRAPTTNLNREPTGSAISPAPNGDRANWKIYANKELGFTFNYPDSWQYKELDERTKGGSYHIKLAPMNLTASQDGIKDLISIHISDRISTIDSYINSSCDWGNCASASAAVSVMVAGFKGKQFNPRAPIKSIETIFQKNKISYIVDALQDNKFNAYNKSILEKEIKAIYDQILSTFQFLP